MSNAHPTVALRQDVRTAVFGIMNKLKPDFEFRKV
jgi:hypothetical protein